MRTRERAAGRLAELWEVWVGAPLPVRLRAWDGSVVGPAGAPEVVVRSPRALRRMVWRPGELGLADAYLAGELEVAGDVGEALALLGTAVRQARGHGPEAGGGAARPGPGAWVRSAALVAGLGGFGVRPPAPGAARSRQRGALHSTARDRAAIRHHYDLSNAFYELLLDESMAYSCAWWTRPAGPGYGLAEAQRDKLELICRKLGLGPGARLLDLGCGWGALAVYAAREHGVRVTAVTLSREQAAYVRERARRAGVAESVTVEHAHWREVRARDFDAVSVIEMSEHVGDREYPAFTGLVREALRPGGRVLAQVMSRGAQAPGGGAFIEAYVVPDMHMRPLGATVGRWEGAGLEVRSVDSLREDYGRTIRAWAATLEERRAEFTALVGAVTVRVWRLYLAGSALTFEEGRMGVDQILAVRPEGADGAGWPLAAPRAWYAPGAEAGRS
ncbi:class I SAM-dependent methyltransferase [Streptomyces sp. BI20]|uniref:class I SAM-dependent methyltransferase n=1 Tax=Streptomyces sp. BI20 TaxID=3403460 RepID=UPI003C71ACB1